MGRGVFDAGALDELVARVGALHHDTTPRWGSLDAARMLRHLRFAFDLPAFDPGRGKPRATLKQFVARSLFLGPVPFPRGIKAPDEYTPDCAAEEFEAQREAFLEQLRAFVAAGPGAWAGTHLVFGPLDGRQWGRLAYKHAAHHLKQFGV